MPRSRCALIALSALILSVSAYADEVDDILRLKQHNQDRIKKFSGDFTVEVDQPKNGNLKNPKTVRMHYRMTAEKIPPQARHGSPNPWRVETEVIEPLKMKMKIEGDHVWFFDQHNQWVELPMTPKIREQLGDMAERFLGSDPTALRKVFHVGIIAKSTLTAGRSTRTIEFVPRKKGLIFARMEEDVDSDGLAIETRLFNESGGLTTKVEVKSRRLVSGVPFAELTESRANSPAGIVITRTTCQIVSVE